ncbi:hypothetical protein D3C84_514940 [compost metagenome]
MLARTSSPRARALPALINMIAATPSAGTKPSASSPKASQCPRADNMFERWANSKTSGVANTETPATNAVSHSPARSCETAICKAVNDDEQAVSRLTEGPWKS